MKLSRVLSLIVMLRGFWEDRESPALAEEGLVPRTATWVTPMGDSWKGSAVAMLVPCKHWLRISPLSGRQDRRIDRHQLLHKTTEPHFLLAQAKRCSSLIQPQLPSSLPFGPWAIRKFPKCSQGQVYFSWVVKAWWICSKSEYKLELQHWNY